jgi:hypothetical protein
MPGETQIRSRRSRPVRLDRTPRRAAPPTVNIIVGMDEEMLGGLRGLAAAERLTIADIVRRAVRAELVQQGT